MKFSFSKLVMVAAITALVPLGLAAAGYPEKEVRMVLPFGPGGATDVIFRLISSEAEKHFGQTIVPINMPGAGATRGSREVKDAKPDGYTLLGSHDTIALSSLAGMADYSYDAFEPVILLTQTINMIASGSDPKVTSAADIGDYVKEHPGDIAISMIPSSTDHFFWVSFLENQGIDMKNIRLISYPDTGEQVAAIMGGDIDFAMLNLPSAGSQIKANLFTPIAVGSEKRLAALPDTPTLIEQGIDLTTSTSRGIFAPKGTPKDVIEKIAAAYIAALENKDLRSRIENKFGSIVNVKTGQDYIDFLTKNEASFAAAAKNMDFSN